MKNLASSIHSLLHFGHLVALTLSNSKPHFLHLGGCITSLLPFLLSKNHIVALIEDIINLLESQSSLTAKEICAILKLEPEREKDVYSALIKAAKVGLKHMKV